MKFGRPVLVATVVVGAAYLASLFTLFRIDAESLVEALFLLGFLGVMFPALAWALTRQQAAHRPAAAAMAPRSLASLLLYLAVFAILVLGWGFSALDGLELGPRLHETAKLVLKIATMVALPLLLFAQIDRGLRGEHRDRRRNLIAFCVLVLTLLAFQAVFGRGLKTLGELDPALTTLLWAVPACALWEITEAGLCEEVLFRRVLQERLADATGSQFAAVMWSTLLFGLAHVPGLWMRGGHLMEGAASATPAWAIAYSVAMIAPAGIVFGVLWARTRCLWLVVILHGLLDLLPQLAPFITTWSSVAGS